MISCRVYDIIPHKDIVKIAALEEKAVELENQARSLNADAQDIRTRAEGIVASYQEKIKVRGWDACKAEADHENMLSWYFDPLPGVVR